MQLEENAITGIFIRKSIAPNIDATYEAKFNDIYFEQVNFLITHLIKKYEQYKKSSLQNLNLKSFTNNNDDRKVCESPHYSSFQNDKNFISNTAVYDLIKQLNTY